LLSDEKINREALVWLKAWDDIVFPNAPNKVKKFKVERQI